MLEWRGDSQVPLVSVLLFGGQPDCKVVVSATEVQPGGSMGDGGGGQGGRGGEEEDKHRWWCITRGFFTAR